MARTASSGSDESISSPASCENLERSDSAEGDNARSHPESGVLEGNEASPQSHTRPKHRRPLPRPFEIGIVMAGAISAGAYTAGVMDFLIQALDAWQRMKDAGKDVHCPRHEVRLKVISGASAGGMTAALTSGMLCEDFEHVVSDQVESAVNNKLFESWVRKIDIRRLLEARDLKDTGAARLLAPRFERARGDCQGCLPFPGRRPGPASTAVPERPPPHHSDAHEPPRGTLQDGRERAARHELPDAAACRSVAFRPELEGGGPVIFLRPALVEEVASTTGTVGASSGRRPWRRGHSRSGSLPCALHRRVLEYADREKSLPEPFKVRGGHHVNKSQPIPPYWPDAMPDDFDFLCVDGGVIDNEPLELARKILVGGRSHTARDGRHARRATLLVDPFPNVSPFPVDYHDHMMYDSSAFSLFRLGRSLFAGLVDQARFKPEELQLAVRPDVYSRFLIEPVRYDGSGHNEMEYAIACGSVFGFGGFLSEKFRRHDYQLGRRNCQQFLRKYFLLPETNPLFDRRLWSPQAREAHRVYWSKDGQEVRPFNHTVKDDDVPHLPIIPLVDDAADPVPAPAWPEFSVEELDELQPFLQRRLDRVVGRLLKQYTPGLRALYRPVFWIPWLFERHNLTNKIRKWVGHDLKVRGLLPSESKHPREPGTVSDRFPAPFPAASRTRAGAHSDERSG